MKTIRFGTFETNSSSSHSLLIMSEEEYKKLCNEELYLGEYFDLISREQFLEDIKEKLDDEELENWNGSDEELLNSYNNMNPWDRREIGTNLQDLDASIEVTHYTSKSGDKVVGVAIYEY